MQIRCRECGNTDDFRVHLDAEIDLEDLQGKKNALLFNLAEVYPLTCKQCGNYDNIDSDFEVGQAIVDMVLALK